MEDKPRYSRISDIIQLIVLMLSKLNGVSLQDIQDEFNVSRRTAERMRDSILAIMPQVDEIETQGRTKRWGFTNYSMNEVITFDTDMDIDLVSNVKIYRISRSGAYIKNDSGLNVGSVKPINIKINKSDIDITVNAKVVNIERDKAQVKFLDMPEDVANKIMYRYFQKANNKNIELTHNNL